MNIADKGRLYAEARRVLAPGGRLALWDVTAGSAGPLRLPVPWATSTEQSHLVSPDRLAELLGEAGFATAHWNDLTERAEKAMRAFLAGEQPPLGLHVFVPDFPVKAANLVAQPCRGSGAIDPGGPHRKCCTTRVGTVA
jgi:sarcosine/dimethylglycine N-methyltransferase